MPTRRTTPLTLSALVAVLGLLFTACGSSDSESGTSAEPDATTSSAPSGAPGGPGGFDQDQLDAIQKCLEAAGLGDAFPTDVPTDRPSGFPSDGATGEPPTDFPSDLPSDLPSGGPGQGGPGGGFETFNDPAVQAALKACGIELPTGRPSPPASS